MLKSVFIGSKNDFDEMLVHWLSQRTDVVGVVWTEALAWRRTWKGRLQFALTRARRYGVLKMLDEVLFYLHYYALVEHRNFTQLKRRVLEPYWAQHGKPAWHGPAIFTGDVNAPGVLKFLRERQPDIGLAMCINEYFGKELRSIPRFGVFLWHEGITPEYKGLWSPFWAIHNADYGRIGYTLLRMNDSYDAGEVFVQGRANDIDPLRHPAPYIGHKAIADSLPAVERFLADLEAGSARPIDRSDAPACYYTYPGISDLVRQRLRLLGRRTAAARRETAEATPGRRAAK